MIFILEVLTPLKSVLCDLLLGHGFESVPRSILWKMANRGDHVVDLSLLKRASGRLVGIWPLTEDEE